MSLLYYSYETSVEKRIEAGSIFKVHFPIYILLNNSKFDGFVYRIYTIDLEIKDTTDTARSVSCLELHLDIDSEELLRTKLYDKRDDFNFPIVNFPSICSNVPATPAYGVHISQLIRYSRACDVYHDSFIEGWS